MSTITKYLDDYLILTGRTSIGPVEANAILAKAGILQDSKDRSGKPLRELLRKGQLPHAFQSGGKGSNWVIPLTKKQMVVTSNHLEIKRQKKAVMSVQDVVKTFDSLTLKKQLEEARLKYKPDYVKYLLVAEAPPDGLERFFYYNNVRQHDHLFLGVIQALYSDLKDKFLASGRSSDIKHSILAKFQKEGFYLLDLSELPRSSLLESDLSLQLPNLIEKINQIADCNTKIILIKANVYDIAFHILNGRFENVINKRIAFPAQGGQRKFQFEFKEALKMVGYL